MRPDRVVVSIILLAVAVACGVRTAPAPRRFCEIGFLILPGQYMGAVGFRIRSGGDMIVRPLLAVDSICLRAEPTPWVQPPIDTNPGTPTLPSDVRQA